MNIVCPHTGKNTCNASNSYFLIGSMYLIFMIHMYVLETEKKRKVGELGRMNASGGYLISFRNGEKY